MLHIVYLQTVFSAAPGSELTTAWDLTREVLGAQAELLRV